MKDNEFEKLLNQSVRSFGNTYFDESDEQYVPPHAFSKDFLSDIYEETPLYPIMVSQKAKKPLPFRIMRYAMAAAAVLILVTAIIIVPQLLSNRVETQEKADSADSTDNLVTSSTDDHTNNTQAADEPRIRHDDAAVPSYDNSNKELLPQNGIISNGKTKHTGDDYTYEGEFDEKEYISLPDDAAVPSYDNSNQEVPPQNGTISNGETEHTGDDYTYEGEFVEKEYIYLPDDVRASVYFENSSKDINFEQALSLTKLVGESMLKADEVLQLPDYNPETQIVFSVIAAQENIKINGMNIQQYSAVITDNSVYLTCTSSSSALYYVIEKDDDLYKRWYNIFIGLE